MTVQARASSEGGNSPGDIGTGCHPAYTVRVPYLFAEKSHYSHLSVRLHDEHHQLGACAPSGPTSCLIREVLSVAIITISPTNCIFHIPANNRQYKLKINDTRVVS